MEEKLLEKEYNIPFNTFCDAYKEFQKKYVCPRSYILMSIFLVLTAIYVVAAVKDPSNKLAYILTFVCFAFAGINWYNPKRIRRSLLESVREIGDDRYKITLFDTYIEISTLQSPSDSDEKPEPQKIQESAENSESPENCDVFDTSESSGGSSDENIFPDDASQVIESSKLFFNKGLRIVEKNNFFMLYQVREMFYVVPKSNFSEDEINILRSKIQK